MRLRGLSIGVFGVALVAGAMVWAWPSLSQRLAGLVADRLARETGLAWHVGGLELDPAPGLVLRDVTFGGDGISGRLRRVRASGPVALLWGGSGTVAARIEGASLILPSALLSAPPAARRGATGDGSGERLGVSALRAVLHGGEAVSGRGEPGRGDPTLSLAAAAVDLALDLAPAAPGRDPSVRLELPDRGAVVEIEAAPRAAARSVRLTLAPEGGPPIAASASARLDATALRLEAIAGTIDRAPFSGSLSAERPAGAGAKPRLTLDLRLDALALAEAGAPMRADPVAGITVPVRADLVPDPAWFSAFSGQAKVAVQRLALGPVRATAVALSARVTEGRLDAAIESATLYQGGARGRYVLEPDGRHQIGLSLSGVRVLPLMRDVAGVESLDGTGGARLDVQAEGGDAGRATVQGLLRGASGQVEVSAVDGRIDGLDLARAAGLTSFGGGLATRLDRLGARFAVRDGRATTGDLQLRTGLIEAEGAGDLDLIARTIDLRLKPLKVTAGGRLNVPIRIAGPWDAPAVSADFAGLAQDPAGALQGLQNLGSSILGGGDGTTGPRGGDLGGGLGGLLDGLLPRQDRAPRRRP